MQISEKTLSVLKNFSTINPNFMIIPGNVIRTLASDKNILAEAIVDETFDVNFGIYDLPQFLGNITTLENPNLSFTEDTVTIQDASFKILYRSCSPAAIVSPGDKALALPKVDAEFSVKNKDLQNLLRLANMNGLPFLSFVGEDGSLLMRTHDKSDTSNIIEIKVGEYEGGPFVAKFKTEHIKVIPDDYNVKIAFGSFALFENTNQTLKYFIGLQSK